MLHIAPSLLEADYRFLYNELKTIKQAGAEYVHIDVMDGTFVPNLSLGMKEIASIRISTDLYFDVHMMVQKPERFVKQMKAAGADCLVVHYEACSDLRGTLRQIRELGMETGVALKLETPTEVLDDELIKMVQVVHLMTVEPGVEGQIFQKRSLERIRAVRARIDALGTDCRLEVDGGIGMNNVQDVVRAGADTVVSGKALFAGNLEKNIIQMRQLMESSSGEAER